MRTPRFALPLLFLLGCASGESTPAKTTTSSAPSGSQKIEVSLPVEEMDLPNGLHVVFHPMKSAPGVLVHMRYEVGSKDDPPGRAGFAHLFEHLMFRGSKDTKGRDYQSWVDEIGGSSNADTRIDSTDYYVAVPPSAVARALWLESDRMAYPLASLDEEAFKRERSVVENEAREHYENQPLGRLDTIARAAVFGSGHPYATSPIGLMPDLEASTLADARAFAQRFYTPQNATLVVVGTYDDAVTKDLVKKYFGTVPPGKKRDVRQIPPVTLAAPRRIEVDANVDGPAVMVAWPAPGDHAPGMLPLGFGLELVTGQIERRLVTEKRIANGVEYRYQCGELGGLVTILVRLDRGASPDAAIGVIDDAVDTMSRIGSHYAFDQLPTRKTLRIVSEVDHLETMNGRAERLLDDLRWHGKVNAMQADLQEMQAVDPVDIGGSVEQLLRKPPHITLVVTPRADAPRAGRVR